MRPTAPAWHVLRTAPQRELAVAARLQTAGLVPLVPVRQVWRARWLTRARRRTDEAEAPLLTSYVFLAAIVRDWPAVLSVTDVRGLLLADGHPAVVADAELAELRNAARKAAISAGDRMAVELGPFQGHNVTVLAVDDARKQVGAELRILGAARQVKLSVDVLQTAA